MPSHGAALPSVVALFVGQNWKDEQLYRDVLRKLHTASPYATIRVPARGAGAAREARDFAEALGLTIEEWAIQPWPKYGSEIRNQNMLDGFVRDVRNPLIVLESKPRADLVLAFKAGDGGNIGDAIKRRLQGADPIVVYEEIWTKTRGVKEKKFGGVRRAENDKRVKHKLGDWRKT